MMLTKTFYQYLAERVYNESQGGDSLYIGIGLGDPDWDTLPSSLDRSTLTFRDEVARLPVLATNVRYVNSNGSESRSPTSYIQVSANFIGSDVTGPMRETGLFGIDATGDVNTGQLLSYFTHPRVDKTDGMDFERIVTLDLNPTQYRFEGHLTRYLGNSKSEELHDLENETRACQINEIRIDRAHYFDNVEQALSMGYDYCAFCFGRDLSQR